MTQTNKRGLLPLHAAVLRELENIGFKDKTDLAGQKALTSALRRSTLRQPDFQEVIDGLESRKRRIEMFDKSDVPSQMTKDIDETLKRLHNNLEISKTGADASARHDKRSPGHDRTDRPMMHAGAADTGGTRQQA